MKTQQTFEELTGLFADYLRQIRRREDTICRYAQLWARIKIFMDSRHMQFYNKQVGEAYLTFLFGDTEYSRLKKYYQVLWNSVEALAEFQATGTVLMGKRRNPSIQLNGRWNNPGSSPLIPSPEPSFFIIPIFSITLITEVPTLLLNPSIQKLKLSGLSTEGWEM